MPWYGCKDLYHVVWFKVIRVQGWNSCGSSVRGAYRLHNLSIESAKQLRVSTTCWTYDCFWKKENSFESYRSQLYYIWKNIYRDKPATIDRKSPDVRDIINCIQDKGSGKWSLLYWSCEDQSDETMTNILSLSEELLQLPITMDNVDYDEIRSQLAQSIDEMTDLSNIIIKLFFWVITISAIVDILVI